MTSKELRIGNWISVYNPYFNFEVRVVEITAKGITHTPSPIGAVNNQLISGIQLTEEWLLRAGFEKKPSFMWLGNGNDYQPEYPRTYHQDYFNGQFVYRLTEWHWKNKGVVEVDKSIELLHTDNWYNKTYEGSLNASECKFVHQLQNLYFALTQTELKIK